MSSTKYPTSEYIKLIESGELETFNEAMTHMDKDKLLKVMQEEMNFLHEN